MTMQMLMMNREKKKKKKTKQPRKKRGGEERYKDTITNIKCLVSISSCTLPPPRTNIIVPRRYRTKQLLAFLRLTGAGDSTHRIASSNTPLSPFCVRAEHSRYRTARISFAIWTAWLYVMGAIRRSRKRAFISGSSRKSNFVPTRRMGVSGAWCDTSGHHLVLAFSKLEGLTIEKHMRKTSVCGYESGRNRS